MAPVGYLMFNSTDYHMSKFSEFLFPHTCILCHAHTHRAMDLCSACEQSLPFIQHSCHCCGIPIPSDTHICGKCLKRKPIFDKTFALFHYQTPIIQMISQLKFNQQLGVSKILGDLMANHLSPSQKLECIIPVPLHNKRLKERGFNQALEIAKPISKKLQIPINIKSCKRIRNTEHQTAIPAKLRKRNVRNAFQVIKLLRAKHIVILDDVMTTGNTVSELARILRHKGVEKIDVWCCARTDKSMKSSL
jgi:ComF family protein